jgi:uncharacterized membrane protein YfcA
VTVAQIVAAAIVVALSAWIQASVGFGYALVSAPLLALVSPPLVPGPVMVSSFVLSAATGWRERQCIDRRGVTVALLARAPGALLSGLALSVLSLHALNVLFGGLVLLAVAISALGTRVRSVGGTAPALTPSGIAERVRGGASVRSPATPSVSVPTPNLVVAGFASGFIGTLTSIGGPPMALVYQHVEGPVLRATLNTYFALGSVMSIGALAFTGHFGRHEWVSGVLLLPPVGIGFALSGVTRQWLDRGYTQRAVLAIAGVSALGVVIKTLFG